MVMKKEISDIPERQKPMMIFCVDTKHSKLERAQIEYELSETN